MPKEWVTNGGLHLPEMNKVKQSGLQGIFVVDEHGRIKSCVCHKGDLSGNKTASGPGALISEIIPEIGEIKEIGTGSIKLGGSFEQGEQKFSYDYYPFALEGVIKGGVLIISHQMETELDNTCSGKLVDLSCAFETSADGLVTVDKNGILTRMNRAYEEMVGVDRDDFVGKPVALLKQKKALPDLVSLYVLKEHKQKSLLIQAEGRDMLLTGTPVFGKGGYFRGVIANIRDMTELNKNREEIETLRDSNARYRVELEALRGKKLNVQIVAVSPKMKEVLDTAVKAAQFDSNVLITGDTGTGKEVVAKLIHRSSPRAEGPFISINCGAIPPTLLESELFGYEPGAFSGAAVKGKPGLFETANRGTLLLDEIGELNLELQVKLLRVLQERSVVRIGGNKPVQLDVRIIAATNRKLREMVGAGTFRSDLYYRLNVVHIEVPPLRERKEDVSMLVQHFLNMFNRKYHVHKKIEAECIERFRGYDWPGNVRELENAIERAIVLTPGDTVTWEAITELGLMDDFSEAQPPEKRNLQEILNETEKKILIAAYEKYQSTRKVAVFLGISQPSVVRKLKKYGYSCAEG